MPAYAKKLSPQKQCYSYTLLKLHISPRTLHDYDHIKVFLTLVEICESGLKAAGNCMTLRL